jgi:oligopeptide transport system ATP-binding protein
VNELFAHPTHPYTLGLISSLPRVDKNEHTRLYSIEGQPPILFQKPQSCPFAPRCKWAMDRCWKENPTLELVSDEHRVACWVDTKTGSAR